MIGQNFRHWAEAASPASRADAASALARAYLYADLDAARRRDIFDALTGILDDPSPLVRRALAEALASAAEAPAPIVLALADDQPSIAAIVLARSPVLTDAALVECAISSGPAAQAAIASRPALSALVVATLAELAAPDPLVTLVRNEALRLSPAALGRIAERHGDQPALREALLARGDLPASVRVDLVAATTRALAELVGTRDWLCDERMRRIAFEAKDKAAVVIAAQTEPADEAVLVAHLRQRGQLSVGLVLRTVLSGRLELFKHILADLSGVALGRVDGLVGQVHSAGFAALYRKTGMPEALLPVFRLAVEAAHEIDWLQASEDGLCRTAVEYVLTGCETLNQGQLDRMLVLLRRFEAEAAREEARRAAARRTQPLLLAERPAPLLLRDLDDDEPAPIAHRADRGFGALPAIAARIDLAAMEAELRAA